MEFNRGCISLLWLPQQNTTDRVFQTTGIYFLTVSGKSAFWLADSYLLAIPSYSPSLVCARGEKVCALVSLIRTLILSDHGPTLVTLTLIISLEAPSSNITLQETGLQHKNFRGTEAFSP